LPGAWTAAGAGFPGDERPGQATHGKGALNNMYRPSLWIRLLLTALGISLFAALIVLVIVP
jgi:hypothetical protein